MSTPGEPRAVDLGQRGAERREQPGAALAVAGGGGLDHLETVDPRELLAQAGARLVELLRPLADGLRGRAVGEEHGDVVERLALLADHHRIGQRQHAERQHRRAPEDAAGAPPQPEGRDRQDDQRERRQQRPGQQRREAQ